MSERWGTAFVDGSHWSQVILSSDMTTQHVVFFPFLTLSNTSSKLFRPYTLLLLVYLFVCFKPTNLLLLTCRYNCFCPRTHLYTWQRGYLNIISSHSYWQPQKLAVLSFLLFAGRQCDCFWSRMLTCTDRWVLGLLLFSVYTLLLIVSHRPKHSSSVNIRNRRSFSCLVPFLWHQCGQQGADGFNWYT